MLSFPAAIKVYLCTVPCAMRRSFDGLSMMAEHVIHCNPFSGHLLVFCNRRTDRLKILYWDRDGWVTWYKRLGGVLSLALFSIMGIPFYFSAAGYATVGYGDVVLPRCGGPLGPVFLFAFCRGDFTSPLFPSVEADLQVGSFLFAFEVRSAGLP